MEANKPPTAGACVALTQEPYIGGGNSFECGSSAHFVVTVCVI